MNPMTKCDEGHFYDKSQNHACPFCPSGLLDLTASVGSSFGKALHHHDQPSVAESLAPTFDKRAGDMDDEKTRRYSSDDRTRKAGPSQGADDDDGSERTVAVWSGKSGIDPVVGWLVCYEGANKGRDYRVRSGFNSIGRDTSSQICIAGDETITRLDHAKIFYDPKRGNFHIVPGDGRSGAYVNDQVVLQSTLLKAYDKLEIGSTKLMFVPFCGDHFLWNMEAADQRVRQQQRQQDPVDPPSVAEWKAD